MEAILDDNLIFACTATGVKSELLKIQKFNAVIVDDASMLTEPMILPCLIRADRFVLFGDHLTQKPNVKSKIARRKGLNESLFEKLLKLYPAPVVTLTKQYRMQPDMSSYLNELMGKHG